jgi:hypothetical protein
MKIDISQLSFIELKELHDAVGVAMRTKDPAYIAEQKRFAEILAKRQKEGEAHEEKMERIIPQLKTILKPGMRLKMKGCKDGKGIREFIKWDDNDHLVCWQVSLIREWNSVKQVFKVREVKTNFVTTHMPDKIQMIQCPAGGQLVPLSKIIS